MATVLDKSSFALSVTLLVCVYISGCASVMPLEHQAAKAGNDRGIQDGPAQVTAPGGGVTVPGQALAEERIGEGRQQVMIPAGDVPLPRQAYNSAGEKVPYVPQPNPYTAKTNTVPTEAWTIFLAASGQLRGGDLRGARTRFRELTEKYPSLAGPWVKLGEIAERKEKYDEAIKHYRKAISVNRDNVNAYIALGLLQRRQGQFLDAQQTYLHALGVWRDFPEAHLNLAILYDLYANRPEEAQKHYEAYFFLTGGKDEKVRKWLVEVKQRTGIEQSFVDIPPADAPEAPVARAADASGAAGI
jgi:tetratricopeptide (TPR) repeat protein